MTEQSSRAAEQSKGTVLNPRIHHHIHPTDASKLLHTCVNLVFTYSTTSPSLDICPAYGRFMIASNEVEVLKGSSKSGP